MLYNWKESIDNDELNSVVKALVRGELVVFPTETVYGIGADVFNIEAVKNIYKADRKSVV